MARVYESRTNRALVRNYFIARKYCVLSRYVANNYINVFPANTFFNGAYQTISDIQFIATGRVAPVTAYNNRFQYDFSQIWTLYQFHIQFETLYLLFLTMKVKNRQYKKFTRYKRTKFPSKEEHSSLGVLPIVAEMLRLLSSMYVRINNNL